VKGQVIESGLPGIRTVRIKKFDQCHLDNLTHVDHLCELIWVEKGYGQCVFNKQVQAAGNDELILTGPGLSHVWQNDRIFSGSENKRRLTGTIVYFSPNFLLNLSDEYSTIRKLQELLQRASRGLRFFGTTVQQAAKIISLIPEDQGLEKVINLLQVIDVLLHAHEYEYIAPVALKNTGCEMETDRISRVYQFLLKNFHRNIELAEVSDLCNMTPNAFCRFFKSRTSKSLTQALNELRVGHACKLLQNDQYSILDVCYESGYNNMTNFNKFFKSITTETPSGYKKKLALKDDR
jgi:AraC-like DNA-binding protein